MFDFIFHIDHYLELLFTQYGPWTYAILFLIIFCETGLVVMPFLPGDSLLFALGVLAASLNLNIHFIVGLLLIAAILGDTVNYWIGYWSGPKIFKKHHSLFFNPHYLAKAQSFYEKYGGKTIIIARFIPIIRTFAPFVAGVGKMNYHYFVFYNILGAVLWVAGIAYTSYLFGNVPIVKGNFSLIIMLIIIVSILPAVIEYIRVRSKQE